MDKESLKSLNDVEKSLSPQPFYGYRTSIGFGQSVQTGIINIHGEIKYNYSDESHDCIDQLIEDLTYFNERLENANYRTARNIEIKQVPDKKGTGGTVKAETKTE